MTDSRSRKDKTETQPDPAEKDVGSHQLSAIIKAGLRSIAASIPVAASLGQVWNEYETHRTSKRIRALFEDLEAELKALAHTVENQGAALKRCQDFPELLEIAIDKVRKEFAESKRAKYARILAKFLVGDEEVGAEQGAALLESLDTLSETDLEVLFLFKGRQESSIRDLQWQDLGFSGDPAAQVWEVVFHLAKLESRGLTYKISDAPGTIHQPRHISADAARAQEAKYRLLPMGARLIAILS